MLLFSMCVFENLMSEGPLTADQCRFAIIKNELQNKSSVWHSKVLWAWFGWWHHRNPSTFSRAVLLLSSFLSSLSFHDICFHQQLHSSQLKQGLKALLSFQGSQKRPQGSWSWSSSPSDLWPHDFSFGSRMQRLSNLQKEGGREKGGMGKRIGMRGRRWENNYLSPFYFSSLQ